MSGPTEAVDVLAQAIRSIIGRCSDTNDSDEHEPDLVFVDRKTVSTQYSVSAITKAFIDVFNAVTDKLMPRQSVSIGPGAFVEMPDVWLTSARSFITQENVDRWLEASKERLPEAATEIVKHVPPHLPIDQVLYFVIVEIRKWVPKDLRDDVQEAFVNAIVNRIVVANMAGSARVEGGGASGKGGSVTVEAGGGNEGGSAKVYNRACGCCPPCDCASTGVAVEWMNMVASSITQEGVLELLRNNTLPDGSLNIKTLDSQIQILVGQIPQALGIDLAKTFVSAQVHKYVPERDRKLIDLLFTKHIHRRWPETKDYNSN